VGKCFGGCEFKELADKPLRVGRDEDVEKAEGHIHADMDTPLSS